MICDRQKDAQGKTICLPTLKGGRHKYFTFNTKVLDQAGIKFTTPRSAIRLAINCAKELSVFIERKYYLVLASVIQRLFHGVHLPHSEIRNVSWQMVHFKY